MFTDLVIDDKNSILSTMLARVSNILQGQPDFRAIQQDQYLVSLLP